MAESLLTPLFRLSFPVLGKPKAGSSGGKEKYSACMIFDPSSMTPKDKDRMKAIKKQCHDLLREKLGDRAFDKKGKAKAGLMPFRDAAEKDHLGGFEDGMVFANTRTEIKPGIADARSGKVDGKYPEVEASEAYPGIKARAKVRPYYYDVDGNKGVALGLGNIILMRNDERLDGAVAASADFGDIDDDELFDDVDDADLDDDDDLI